MPQLKSFDVLCQDGIDIVRVNEAKLSYVTLEALQKTLIRKIDDGSRLMVLNLSPVGFVDSFGIGVLVVIARRMTQNSGQLKLCGVGERVRMSLTITRLDKTLDIVDNEAAAVSSLHGQA